MTDAPLILAIDLGTSGCKAAIVPVAGEVIGWDFEPVELLLLPGGGAEQRPDDWWNAIVTASRRLLDAHPESKEAIAAVCCNTQGEGTVAIGPDGDPLMNAIIWMDARGAKYVAQQCRGLLNVSGYGVTKLLRWIRLTGGAPSLTGKDSVGHMLLLKHEQPDVYARTQKFLNVVDFLNYKLTGRMVATHDSAVTTWATDNRDANKVVYDAKLIDAVGADADKLPAIVPCTEVIGTLQDSAAEALGLPKSVRVVAGSIDNSAAAIGSGAVDDFDCHLYLGTSSWIAAHVPFKKTDLAHMIAAVPSAIPGRWLMMAMQTTAGGNLTFLRDNVLYHKDALLQESALPDVYKIMDRIVAETPPGANGVMYTPWIYGERAPIEDSAVRAAFMNLSLENTREDMIRAVYEGIALNTRWLLEPSEKFLGKRIERINLIGGGANSRAWCQIFADVFRRPIHQMQDPIQANVRGSAFIAAAGLGLASFDDVASNVPIAETFEPIPNNADRYDELFPQFTSIYHANKKLYRRLNS